MAERPSIPSDPRSDAFAERALRYLDGILDDAGVSQLNADLASHPDYRDLFVRICAIHGQMLEHRIASHWEAAIPRAQSVAWKRSAMAALLLIATGFAWIVYQSFQTLDFMQPPPAMLASQIDATWDGADPSSAPLSAGQPLSLLGGYAELSFAGGAKVVVQGPSRFVVESPNAVRLTCGMLTATVPGGGFAVHTPSATITDLGTEFGVSAGNDKATQVEVFKGKVSLSATLAPGVARPASPAAANLLRAGEAKRVDVSGRVSRSSVSPSDFVRVAKFKTWAESKNESPLQRWRAYIERISRDSSLVACYTFDDAGESTARLRNHAIATAGRFDIPFTLSHPTWTTGRWPGKGALDFRPAAKQGLFLGNFPPASDGNLTVSAWVLARSRPQWAALIRSRGDEHGDGQFAMNLEDQTLIGAAGQGDKPPVIIRDGGNFHFPLNRWVHVAMVINGKDFRLYRDGVQVAGASIRIVPSSPHSHHLTIGIRTDEQGQPIWRDHFECWDGRMDEIAIFHRALSASQIREMYEAGRP